MDEKEKIGRFHRQQEVPSAEEKSKSGTVYDDVFRTMIDKMPHLVIPLINEVFGKQYPDSEPVTALQNEHLEIMEDKVITDSYLKIADKYYHVECQSSPDGTMAIRMIEYDFLIALKHAEKSGYEYTIDYPHSCVLYLRYTDRTPDFLVVHMKFPDGTVVDYRTPIIKVNQYDFEKIFQKKLLFFLPYYIMRYEAVLKEIEEDEEKLRDFLEEYQCIYQKLNALRDCHRLSDYDFTELKRLIETIISHLAYGKERIQKGVRDMGGKVLEFEHDILMRESEARGVRKGERIGVLKGEKIGILKGESRGVKIGEARRLVKNVESVIRTLGLSLEKACEAMETTVGEYTNAKHLILEKETFDE